MTQGFGAGCSWPAYAGAEVRFVLRGGKGGLVMVKPPADLGQGRVFEVDDGVFASWLKPAVLKERTGTVREAVVVKGPGGADAFAMEASKERGGAGAVKAAVVVEDAAVHRFEDS